MISSIEPANTHMFATNPLMLMMSPASRPPRTTLPVLICAIIVTSVRWIVSNQKQHFSSQPLIATVVKQMQHYNSLSGSAIYAG